jgi:ribosomal peptide maturation radical SAM protein 1
VLKIALLNMPFAAYHMPSIGLTQLKHQAEARCGGEVDVRVVYANHELARYMGLELYERIGSSGQHLNAGFAEWFFRQEAFPDQPDNTEAYFARYYPGNDPATQSFRETVLARRAGIRAVLDRVIDKHQLDQADIVGFTSMFFETLGSIALARRLKARNPRILILMGGANCESPAGEELVRNVDVVDYVFSGPSLKSFPRFVENCLSGRMDLNEALDGVFTKANQGRGVGPVGEELDIDTPIPLEYGPFLDTLDESFPDQEIDAVLPFETSRGCWWGERAHCTFCGLNKVTMSYRAMQPARALELIRSLFPYAGRVKLFMCVDNILQRQYVQEVFPYLDTPEGTTIFYQLKANLSEREVAALARAGVKRITPGFESLSTATLKLMDKGVSAFHNLQVMKYCALHDVYPGWNLLVGSPGEGDETYAKYLDELPSLVHLPAPQALFSIHFNRYSPYFVKAEEYKLDLRPLDYYEMVYPFPPESLANVAYDFMDHNFDAEYLQSLSRWIDRLKEKVAYWRTRWQGTDQGLPARLFLFERGGRTHVFDSRDGEPREYELTPNARQLLAYLDEPKLMSSLVLDLGHLAGFDPEREVAWLDERRLLFREGEKLMNVVLPVEPPPMTYHSNGIGVTRRPKQPVETGAMPAMIPIARQPRRMVRVPGA